MSSQGPQTIREWMADIHENAKAKGWWDADVEKSFGDECSLFTSEISEAYEEYRKHKGSTEIYYNEERGGKPEGIPVELADCVIRIFDWFAHKGLDLQAILEEKHRYNKGRAYRHGGKKL